MIIMLECAVIAYLEQIVSCVQETRERVVIPQTHKPQRHGKYKYSLKFAAPKDA